MDVDQWQDKQSGAKRSRMKVVAENVQFLRIRRPEAEAPPGAPGPTSTRPRRQTSAKGPAVQPGPRREQGEFRALRSAREFVAGAELVRWGSLLCVLRRDAALPCRSSPSYAGRTGGGRPRIRPAPRTALRHLLLGERRQLDKALHR
jgi:hypothetical protein